MRTRQRTIAPHLEFTEIEEAVVIDVETTGLDADTDKVVSVAAIRVEFPRGDNGKPVEFDQLETEYLTFLVNPEQPIPPKSDADPRNHERQSQRRTDIWANRRRAEEIHWQ